jgi:hypothetical protein
MPGKIIVTKAGEFDILFDISLNCELTTTNRF